MKLKDQSLYLKSKHLLYAKLKFGDLLDTNLKFVYVLNFFFFFYLKWHDLPLNVDHLSRYYKDTKYQRTKTYIYLTFSIFWTKILTV